jgi:hypothetical protein
MCLQTFPSFYGKGIFVLEASRQEQMEIGELITESQEGSHQLGNAFVTG